MCELRFTPRSEVGHEKIIIAHKADQPTVTGKLGELLETGLSADWREAPTVELPDEELALGVLPPHLHRVRKDQQLGPIRRKLIRLDFNRLLLSFGNQITSAQ